MKKENGEEAKKIIEAIAKEYEGLGYAELQDWVEEKRVETKEAIGSSGVIYQLELEAAWDEKPRGVIRFSISIYDDSSSWFLGAKTPVSYDFLKDSGNGFQKK